MARRNGQIPLTAVQVRKLGLAAAAVLAVLLFIFGLIFSASWSSVQSSVTSPEASGIVGAPHDGLFVQQGYALPFDQLDSIRIELAPAGSSIAGYAEWSLLDKDTVLANGSVSLSETSGNALLLSFPDGLSVSRDLTLSLSFRDPDLSGALPTLYMGTRENAGRLSADTDNLTRLSVDGVPVSARLCAILRGHSANHVMPAYWVCCALLPLTTMLWAFLSARGLLRGRRSRLLWIIEALRHYSFLLRQLVARDFNTKYRQSLLGVLWSFLNPLLTMTVQYIVFSTIFRSSIENFPVYLLTGIVLFNYFSEACTLGLDSIVLNSALINKVYMPKYIYPLSRILSSAINLLVSFVPLLLLMLFTGLRFTGAMLMLPLNVALLMIFTLGITLQLSTLNVFFRDTRFLWGVVVLLWTYLTPLFYPESIIPAGLRTLYQLNPMYHYIGFLRSITMEGAPPSPVTLLACILYAGGALLIGSLVFRRHQDQFVFRL